VDKEQKSELWVGLTAMIALCLLVLGVLWGKGSGLFSKRTALTVRFENVRGLEKGDAVFVRGIETGNVQNIVLGPTFAEVQLRIHNRVWLAKDAEIVIEDRDLMGEKQVSVEPGDDPEPLDRTQVLQGKTRINVLDLLTGTEKVVEQTGSLLIQLRKLVDQGQVERVMKNAEHASLQADRILSENRQTIRAAMAQLENMTRKIQQDSTAERFGRMVTRLDSTLAFLNRITVAAENENGTLGKLIRDRKLYDHLLKTSTDLDSLIADIRRNPKRYIRVSVF